MTTFERFERDIPELMSELAPARVPDYFDDMLLQAARTRQRPAWSALERWLPMGEIALSAPTRRMPWRYLALAAAVLLIVAASLVYVGSRRAPLPPMFGLARNGVIVYGTAAGDIASYDPTTDVTTTLIGGPEVEQFPLFSNDGTSLVFGRTSHDGQSETDFLVAADGTGVRDFLPSGPVINWYDQTAAGDKSLLTRRVDGASMISIVDNATGRVTPVELDPALGITIAMFRPGYDQIIYEHVPSGGAQGTTVYLGSGDGSGDLRPIAISADAMGEAWPSPDGSKLVYVTWGSSEAQRGRINTIDLVAGNETALMFDGSTGTNELEPLYSPDGAHLALTRYGDDGGRVTVVPADGIGPAVEVGPTFPDQGVDIIWSPDATQLLVGYRNDGAVWLLPVDGTAGRKLEGLTWDRGLTWQRLAP
jgi:Tol biopolymer transport system component